MLNLLIAAIAFAPADLVPLWQVGNPNRSAAEFALAPGEYAKYTDDPLYLVGTSRASAWPYVLPGPADSWAKSRVHSASVIFGIKKPPATGTCRFVLDLVETHNYAPPVLVVRINGKQVGRWQAPAGSGDEAIQGKPERGRPARWSLDVPGTSLRTGNNELELASESGSWVVFDALRFEAPVDLTLAPLDPGLIVRQAPSDDALFNSPNGPVQQIRLSATNVGPLTKATFSLKSQTQTFDIATGRQTVEMLVPAVSKARSESVTVQSGSRRERVRVTLPKVKQWTIRVLPHSHVDIGYTNLQPEIEVLHRNTLFQALELASESAGLTKEAQFKWNVESTWVIDKFLKTATPDEKARVFQAIRSGMMGVNGAYVNVLSGLMRPEEMLRTFRHAIEIGEATGVPVDTVSFTDVPGVVWGLVPAMRQAGLKYLALWPNPSDRIGGVRHHWEDKPFYWVGQSGQDKVLVWPMATYALGHWAKGLPGGERFKTFRSAEPTTHFIESFIFGRLAELERKRYPYDTVAFPWSLSDNCPVDGDLPAAVEAWNKRYASPKVELSTASAAFHDLEARYGSMIPSFKGDLSPYWEDGAGSSAFETALNRTTAERLVQAEALAAMGIPFAPNKATSRNEAWDNAIMYSEHTWGAYNSISEPDSKFVRAQWAIKRAFAIDAAAQSRSLIAASDEESAQSVDILNTSSWPRTELIEWAAPLGFDRVEDASGQPLPSQRLSTGMLAVLVRDVPAFGAVRLVAKAGVPLVEGRVTVDGTRLSNALLQVDINQKTGAIDRLISTTLQRDFAAQHDGHRLNTFLYLLGTDLAKFQTNDTPTITVLENGPIVSTLRVESSAPGCESLIQDVRLVAGSDHVLLSNTITKNAVREKEGVHFAFPFAVPGGQMRIDNAWGVLRPELDQIIGSNKNWLNVQRWVDVSNGEFGVTTAVVDAPLLEVGGITANLLGAVTNVQDWVQHLPKTQTFYSWAMNNHWHTNYRADQSDVVTFRYALRPHRAFLPEDAARFGAEQFQPLLVQPVRGDAPVRAPLLSLDNPKVLVSALKPSEDGKALIVRLWGASGSPQRVRLVWREGAGGKAWLSNFAERRLATCPDSIHVQAWGIVTVRVERGAGGG